MDPRIHEHADVLVKHSTEVENGDNVLIMATPEAEDLVVALHEKLGEIGAIPSLSWQSDRANRAYLRAIDEDDIAQADHLLAKVEESDVMIGINGAANTYEQSDIPPEKNSARAAANKAVQEAYLESRWVGTQHPAPGNAQEAEMSTEAYADFVYEAINKDWEAQRAHQEQLVDLLDPASEVRIVSGDTTDITMSVDGMHAINDFGEKNMPGGEVFTAPVPDSVEGEILFDKPLMAQGREITDVYLEFEDGEVVDHAAEKNQDVLGAVLETDEGASRLGELGIGMNRDIDQFTYNMLFDEKMGDTVHLALGRAYEETVGEDVERNDSAQHMDMIVDMAEDSTMRFDGEVVMRDGTFVFEDGFEE